MKGALKGATGFFDWWWRWENRAETMDWDAPPGTPTVGYGATASGTLTEGGDAKQTPGESLSGPVAKPDAQPTPVSDPISNKGDGLLYFAYPPAKKCDKRR